MDKKDLMLTHISKGGFMDKKDLVLTHISTDDVIVEYLWPEKTVKERWVYYYNKRANKLRLGKYKRLVRPTKRHKFKLIDADNTKCLVPPLLYDCRYFAKLSPGFAKERIQGVLKSINEIQLPREVSLFAKKAFGKHLVSCLRVQKRWWS